MRVYVTAGHVDPCARNVTLPALDAHIGGPPEEVFSPEVSQAEIEMGEVKDKVIDAGLVLTAGEGERENARGREGGQGVRECRGEMMRPGAKKT